MNSLKNRCLEGILIAYVDGLSEFLAAIEAVYPKTEIHAVHYPTNTKYN